MNQYSAFIVVKKIDWLKKNQKISSEKTKSSYHEGEECSVSGVWTGCDFFATCFIFAALLHRDCQDDKIFPLF
jgi:hypothetical protein